MADNKPVAVAATSNKRGAVSMDAQAAALRATLKAANMPDAQIELIVLQTLKGAREIQNTMPTVRRAKVALNTPDAFAGNEVPWHKILNGVLERGDTVDQILQKADLVWEPEACESGLKFQNQWFPDNDSKKLVRLRPNATGGNDLVILAPNVSPRYTILKNRDVVTFIHEIAKGLGEWNTLGYFGDGQQVFGCVKLDPIILTRDAGQIDPYIVFRTSHDGSCEFEAWRSTIRPECGNMLNASRRSATKQAGMIAVRHSANATIKVEDAQKDLRVLVGGYREDAYYFNKLLECAMVKDQFAELAKKILPQDSTQTDNRREGLISLFDIKDHERFLGTGFAALQAITRFADHGGMRINQAEYSEREIGSRQAESKMFGKAAMWKTNAYTALIDYLKIEKFDASKSEQKLLNQGRALAPEAKPTNGPQNGTL